MPSYTDFDSTKNFRDKILARTLQVQNGPQSYSKTDYQVQNLSDLPDIDLGAVDQNRDKDLSVPQTKNIYKPEQYFIKENLDVLPRRANLSLYPYFVTGDYTLFSIINSQNLDNESELFKFASNFIT